MNERPKSREETPKEGSDNARRCRTATICDRDAQNARPFRKFFMRDTHIWVDGFVALPMRFFSMKSEH